MAFGKILYTPLQTGALVLDGAHYLSLDDATLNLGIEDFSVDFLLKVDPAVTEPNPWLISKSPSTLVNASGFRCYYGRDTRKLCLTLNDGQATSLTVMTGDNALPAHGNWLHGGLTADRDGQVIFYVSGAPVGSGDISTRAGSLDNNELFRVGGYSADSHCHHGLLGFVRLDVGRVLPAAWWAEEWDRIRFGCLREISDSVEMWQFYDSLAGDAAEARVLEWQGGGEPSFADGWPFAASPLTYLFEEQFTRGYEFGYLDLADQQRAEDGSSFSHAGPLKRYFRLPFKNLPRSQQAAFVAAWQAQQPLQLFLDADQRMTCWAIIKTPPVLNNQIRDLAAGNLDLEEA